MIMMMIMVIITPEKAATANLPAQRGCLLDPHFPLQDWIHLRSSQRLLQPCPECPVFNLLLLPVEDEYSLISKMKNLVC